MANYFTSLFSGIKKDLTPKYTLGLLQDAKDDIARSQKEVPYHLRNISREEFAKRYGNLRLTIIIQWTFALMAFVQVPFIDSKIFAFGALMTGILMVTQSLGHLFRASVARLVWREWDLREHREISFLQYINHCGINPKELLPLKLPEIKDVQSKERLPLKRQVINKDIKP
jgi:hypothetical protein